MPAVFNAANEVAVDAFHDGTLGFLGIWDLIATTMAAHSVASEVALDAVLDADRWARGFATQQVKLSAR